MQGIRFSLRPLVLIALLMVGSAWLTAAVPVEEISVAQLQQAYRNRDLTVRQVVEAHLARIAAYDQQGPILNSIINTNPEALKEADAADHALASLAKGSIPEGPLWGVPVVVKDNLDAVGMPMTNGFQGWKNYYPPTDAPVVAKIKQAGGIILAKASLSEFARGGGDNINSVLRGFARNPYHTAYATGGSSGGTGAALAASFGIVGIGTDTGGSVRMPAAHNALVGLRPTVGLVSRTGVVPLDGVRDTAGPMARCVYDATVLLDVIAGVDPMDAATQANPGKYPASFASQLKPDALKGTRLGVLRQVFKPGVTDPQVLANFEKTLQELRKAGAELVDPFVVPELDTIPRPPQTPASFKHDIEKWFAQHPGVPFGSVRALADSKLLHPLHQAGTEAAIDALPVAEDPATVTGRANEKRFQAAFQRAMDEAKVDALVFPTWAQLPARNGDRNTQLGVAIPKPAPDGGPTALSSSLTFVGSMLQWPAVSVPSGYSQEGLPLGLQILGRAWDDAKIMNFAYAYEQATRYRRPPSSTPPLADSLKDRLIGVWQLKEIREKDHATGVISMAERGAKDGQLVYTANGRLSVQIIRQGREKAAPGTSDGFSSYFGTWSLLLAEGCVVHNQDGNINQAQAGQAAKRYYHFDEKGWLSLETPPRKRDSDGATISSFFVWEKLP